MTDRPRPFGPAGAGLLRFRPPPREEVRAEARDTIRAFVETLERLDRAEPPKPRRRRTPPRREAGT